MQPNNSPERSPDAAFSLSDVIHHRYRYRVLLALTRADADDGISIESTDFGSDCDDPDILEQQLRDDHLPLLDDARLVNWDSQTGVVTRGPRFNETRPVHLSGVADGQSELTPDG